MDNEIKYLYMLYLFNDKNTILNNFYYPKLNIDFNEVEISQEQIDKIKFKINYKIEYIDNAYKIQIMNYNDLLVSYSISTNQYKTLNIKYTGNKLDESILIKTMITNFFIFHKDLNYIFNPLIFDVINKLEFNVNLFDNYTSIFDKYASINSFDLYFNSIGLFTEVNINGGNYFFTIPNDQKIFEFIFNFCINKIKDTTNDILLFGLYYPIVVNNKKTITDKDILFNNKPCIIKSYSIKNKYYYNKYEFYDNSKFRLLFLSNRYVDIDEINKETLKKYNKLIKSINQLKKMFIK